MAGMKDKLLCLSSGPEDFKPRESTLFVYKAAGSSNGRTGDSGSSNLGSSPSPAAAM